MRTHVRFALIAFGALILSLPSTSVSSSIIPGTEEPVAPGTPTSNLPRTLVVRVERDAAGRETSAVVFGVSSKIQVTDERSAVAVNEEAERKRGTPITPTIKPGNSDAYWYWSYRYYPFYAYGYSYGYYPYYGYYYPSYYANYGYYWGGHYYPYSYYRYIYYHGPYAYYYYYYPW